jgi:predicted RNase H-like nuclease (RuvC/YqgF family)
LLQELLVNSSSLEQLEAHCKTLKVEKFDLEKRLNSLRSEFDLERKTRQEITAKNSEFESESVGHPMWLSVAPS